MATATKEEIFSKVQEALVDALGVEDDEVTPEATLQGDLDAESIDFLDIVFRLEKAFDIKIERGELFPEDIPDWFVQQDANGDGQVAMAEFEHTISWSDAKVRKFNRYDLNKDGIITPQECVNAPDVPADDAPADVPGKEPSSGDGGGGTSTPWWMAR